MSVKRPGHPTAIEVPCGHCKACRLLRARDWALRMDHELAYWDKACFVTLTYAKMPAGESICKAEFVRFVKRLRKSLAPERIRFYGVGEYGTKRFRPHYHVILFGYAPNLLTECRRRHEGYVVLRGSLFDAWPHGEVYSGTVTPASIRYVSNYVKDALGGELAAQVYGERERPFSLMSQGLGRRFVDDNAEKLRGDRMVTVHGVPQGLPRYYALRLGIEYDDPEATQERQERISETIQAHVVRTRRDFRYLNWHGSLDASREQAEKDLAALLATKTRG